MKGYVNITVLGTLTRDPEIKTIGDNQVAKFTLVVNENFKEKEFSTFIDCEAWGNEGRIGVLGKFFKKASTILVNGSLRQENWEGPDGGKRSKLLLRVNDFAFTSNASQDNDKQEATPSPKKNGPVNKPKEKTNERTDDSIPF